MAHQDRPGLTPATLLSCGDWACAHANAGGLASVAKLLDASGDSGDTPERRDLVEIVRLAEVDMLRASDLWTQATRRLRARCFGAE